MIEITKFLDRKDLALAKNVINAPENYYDDGGVHNNQLTSAQQWLSPQDQLYKLIEQKLNKVALFTDQTIDGLQILHAVKPYDVHTDFIVQKNQVPISNPDHSTPTYTVIIPMCDNFRTVIFDQSGKYNNFSQYKQQKDPLQDHCSDQQWQEHCSHCHDEDQKYLTIKKVFDWRVGNLFAFDRELFHCSANFSGRKQAIVLWLSK